MQSCCGTHFVPIVCSTSKDKSVYISPHKRNQKMERKGIKPKPLFRSQPKVLDGSKFVPTCHHCGVIGHIRPQYPKLKREQKHVARFLPKKPSEPKYIVCHHCGAFGHLRPHCSKFHALKRIKRKENFLTNQVKCKTPFYPFVFTPLLQNTHDRELIHYSNISYLLYFSILPIK